MKVVLGLALLSVPYVLSAAFGGVYAYDDEGTLMITFRDIMDGRVLYHDIFALYGPFYYLVLTPLFNVLKIPLWHDSVRLISAVFWLGISVALATYAFRLTASKLVGAYSFIISLFLLKLIVHSPMHPQELGFLLVAGLLHAVFEVEKRPRPLVLVLIGAAIGSLLLIKINLGIFAAIPIALAALRITDHNPVFRWLHRIIILVAVLMPAVLMAPLFGSPWVVEFCLFATATVGAASIVWCKADLVPIISGRHWGYALAGFAAVSVFTIVATMQGGTTIDELFSATVLQNASIAKHWNVPLIISPGAAAFALSSLGFALFYAVADRFVPLSKIRLGVIVWLKTLIAIIGAAMLAIAALFDIPSGILPNLIFQAFVPFAWLLAIVPSSADAEHKLNRSVLMLFSAFMALYAYPVAGTQLMLAALLMSTMIPVLANDVIIEFGNWRKSPLAWKMPVRLPSCLGVGLSRLAAGFVVTALATQTMFSVQNYLSLKPLALAGSNLVRAKDTQVSRYHWAVAELSKCPAFYTVPGLLSLHFWTGIKPVTGLNNNNMLGLIDYPQQLRVVADLSRSRNLCILTYPALQRLFDRGQIVARPPISRYIEEYFVEYESNGPFHLLRRLDGH